MSAGKHVGELIQALAQSRLDNHELRLNDRRWINARDIWDTQDKRKDAEIERLRELVVQLTSGAVISSIDPHSAQTDPFGTASALSGSEAVASLVRSTPPYVNTQLYKQFDE